MGLHLHGICTVLSKEIVTGVARISVRVFKDPPVVNWTETGGTNPRNKNTVRMPHRATAPVWISTGPLVFPNRMGSQDIGGPRRSITPQEVRNDEPLDASINGISSKHRDPAPTWIKVIGSKISIKSSADVYLCCWMNLTSDTVLRESLIFRLDTSWYKHNQ